MLTISKAGAAGYIRESLEKVHFSIFEYSL